jgi:hypothetical protein
MRGLNPGQPIGRQVVAVERGEFLTGAEIAKILKLNEQAVRNYIAAGPRRFASWVPMALLSARDVGGAVGGRVGSRPGSRI